MTWLGLWLSLNQAIVVRPWVARPDPAAEATAVFAAGRITFTTIYVQPLRAGEPPILSFGAGFKVF